MEKRFKFLFLLLCCLISSSAIAQQRLRNVSKQEAFSLVKDKFSGQDVDYYLCEDPVLKIEGENNFPDPSQSGTWTFFVDAEPRKGWEHDCYIVRVVNEDRGISISHASIDEVPSSAYGKLLSVGSQESLWDKGKSKTLCEKGNSF